MIHAASSSYTEIFPGQQKARELNHLRVTVDMRIIRHTIGSSAWLTALTQDEFQALLNEILPAVEQEREKRKSHTSH